eukprot:TRINITY_DN336_c0_g1_i2.p2 TRINITY_DN336_c0_g1~~TRINITY_DN336_c0_g1_i2.p2  ORF type:complete len:172 (-),score=27.08 TRINITY_DN336_c0_g1_i2:167-682(-)
MNVLVRSSYTIDLVKCCIECAGGPSADKQMLSRDGECLDSGRTIAHYNTQQGDIIDVSRRQCGGMHHESSGHKDYCSLRSPGGDYESEQGTHSVYPCTVIYLAGGKQKDIFAYVSEAITPEKLLAMIEMETDPTFFTSLTPSQLKAIPQGAVETLSRAALVRMNRALAEAV